MNATPHALLWFSPSHPLGGIPRSPFPSLPTLSIDGTLWSGLEAGGGRKLIGMCGVVGRRETRSGAPV